jgi:hypothetical protein
MLNKIGVIGCEGGIWAIHAPSLLGRTQPLREQIRRVPVLRYWNF